MGCIQEILMKKQVNYMWKIIRNNGVVLEGNLFFLYSLFCHSLFFFLSFFFPFVLFCSVFRLFFGFVLFYFGFSFFSFLFVFLSFSYTLRPLSKIFYVTFCVYIILLWFEFIVIKDCKLILSKKTKWKKQGFRACFSREIIFRYGWGVLLLSYKDFAK